MKNSLSSVGKESTCSAGDQGSPVLGRFPWRRKWQSTPVFLPGKIPLAEKPARPQPMGSQESDTTLVTKAPPPLPHKGAQS